MSSCAVSPTPVHELRITRLIDAPREAVWRAWTDHLAEWWCPEPWTVEIVEQDARPGGRSAMIMRGPAGEVMPQEGVFLEIVPMERIVFTDAFTKGWIPAGPFIVGFMEFADEAGKTRYSAGARPLDRRGVRAARGDGVYRRLVQGGRTAGSGRQADSVISRAVTRTRVRPLTAYRR
ncbi:uncharacterized protein YndB with AHSA1/START domain [Sphingomonas sp. PvP055]